MDLIKGKRGAKVSLFGNHPKEARTIEDILTPKDSVSAEETSEEVREGGADDIKADVSDATTEENVQQSVEKDVKIESREDVSFNALTCFGWSEAKTPKWLIKCARFWYAGMSFFWFVFGALTFAPIIFMQKKVDVVFNSRVKSFIAASLLYATFVSLIILLIVTQVV